REERGLTFIVFSALGLVLVVFVLLPVAELFYSAAPDLGEAVGDPKAVSSITISVTAALSSALVGLLLGTPLAYVLARKEFPGKQFVEGIVDLPMVVPHTVAGIALLVVFGRHGSLGEPLGAMGISFVDAFPGIVVAMLFVSVPFVVNQVREGFEAVDPRLERVAMSLGASRSKVFTTISLPLIRRNLISGGLMAWARSISEFGAVVIIAYFPLSAPVYIYETFTSFGLFAARPVAALLLLISLTAFIALRTVTRRMGVYDQD
ncbi:MAG: ABC transporter permease subunit, partial [Thermoplasmatota archaeon]